MFYLFLWEFQFSHKVFSIIFRYPNYSQIYPSSINRLGLTQSDVGKGECLLLYCLLSSAQLVLLRCGCKYRTTYKHIKAKYVRDGIFSVKYSTKGGDKELQFYHDGFQQNVKAAPDFSDIMPNFRKYTKERSLLHRLKNGICELCGAETKEIVMHHVRKLKDLKGETEWERVMLRIRRKFLALCPCCYNSIQT